MFIPPLTGGRCSDPWLSVSVRSSHISPRLTLVTACISVRLAVIIAVGDAPRIVKNNVECSVFELPDGNSTRGSAYGYVLGKLVAHRFYYFNETSLTLLICLHGQLLIFTDYCARLSVGSVFVGWASNWSILCNCDLSLPTNSAYMLFIRCCCYCWLNCCVRPTFRSAPHRWLQGPASCNCCIMFMYIGPKAVNIDSSNNALRFCMLLANMR